MQTAAKLRKRFVDKPKRYAMLSFIVAGVTGSIPILWGLGVLHWSEQYIWVPLLIIALTIYNVVSGFLYVSEYTFAERIIKQYWGIPDEQ
jgi:hypothetical protein